eukprot:CAMPEP_0174383942 /NCGR_PEP_ID=MMETSP0811_2-20130205/125585_1 /TAXON_ID=73025 ORGANISM="Eutreptiella gymnastica-like, Strain CCMP1594" /NCGR_SAMPLE_ID=MMETSP0811_2 /ASSEMBLY_ACC=CAM_ASM_000667 /LENGTH=312 /DNA_ID=CAMNT_0015537729 /DNA_START=471 /DNA_END=1409 /DNA_ORIENTATION=-
MSPEEAIDFYLRSAVNALKRDQKVFELKCTQLEEELEKAACEGQREAPRVDAPPPKKPHTAEKWTVVDVKWEEDAEAKDRRYKAKSKKLEKENAAIRKELDSGRKFQSDGLTAKLELLDKELAQVEVDLNHERQRVKDKIQKNLELKTKIAQIVEKAKDRDNRRKQRIQTLQTLLVENGVAGVEQVDESAAPEKLATQDDQSQVGVRRGSEDSKKSRSRSSPAAKDGPSEDKGGGAKLQTVPHVGRSIWYKNMEVVVRFVGDVHFAEGTWLGIELATPGGKNDGTVKGVQYFACRPKHGLFIPWVPGAYSKA